MAKRKTKKRHPLYQRVRRVVTRRNRKNSNSWFRKRIGAVNDKWGFIPINWKGWTALIVLIVLNVFSVNYFDIMNSSFEDVSKFLVVFLLSIAVFVLIAKRKTEGNK